MHHVTTLCFSFSKPGSCLQFLPPPLGSLLLTCHFCTTTTHLRFSVRCIYLPPASSLPGVSPASPVLHSPLPRSVSTSACTTNWRFCTGSSTPASLHSVPTQWEVWDTIWRRFWGGLITATCLLFLSTVPTFLALPGNTCLFLTFWDSLLGPAPLDGSSPATCHLPGRAPPLPPAGALFLPAFHHLPFLPGCTWDFPTCLPQGGRLRPALHLPLACLCLPAAGLESWVSNLGLCLVTATACTYSRTHTPHSAYSSSTDSYPRSPPLPCHPSHLLDSPTTILSGGFLEPPGSHRLTGVHCLIHLPTPRYSTYLGDSRPASCLGGGPGRRFSHHFPVSLLPPHHLPLSWRLGSPAASRSFSGLGLFATLPPGPHLPPPACTCLGLGGSACLHHLPGAAPLTRTAFYLPPPAILSFSFLLPFSFSPPHWVHLSAHLMPLATGLTPTITWEGLLFGPCSPEGGWACTCHTYLPACLCSYHFYTTSPPVLPTPLIFPATWEGGRALISPGPCTCSYLPALFLVPAFWEVGGQPASPAFWEGPVWVLETHLPAFSSLILLLPA